MIEITNLKKNFGDLEVLSDINLNVKEGEIYGLVGTSGAGKSTLLRCINKIEDYDGGSIKINGVDIASLNKKQTRELRRNIGMIFQHFPLLTRKSVYDNIAFPMQCWGYQKSEVDERVRSLAEVVGIADKLDMRPSTLSGGQKQRVAIARALSMNPKILLSDEATSALDPGTTRSTLALLRKINEEMGITIVVVTHQMDVVRQICQRVSLLQNGKIVLSGPVDELFINQPDALRNFLSEDTSMQLPEGVNLRIMLTENSDSRKILYTMAKELPAEFTVCGGNTEVYRDRQLGSIVINISENDKALVSNYLDEHHIVFHEAK